MFTRIYTHKKATGVIYVSCRIDYVFFRVMILFSYIFYSLMFVFYRIISTHLIGAASAVELALCP